MVEYHVVMMEVMLYRRVCKRGLWHFRVCLLVHGDYGRCMWGLVCDVRCDFGCVEFFMGSLVVLRVVDLPQIQIIVRAARACIRGVLRRYKPFEKVAVVTGTAGETVALKTIAILGENTTAPHCLANS